MPGNGKGSRRWRWLRPVRVSRAAEQEADRRTGERLVALLDPAGKAEVDDLLTRGEVIPAIRRVRELTGLRLIDAKRLVESLQPRRTYSSQRLERVLDYLGFRSDTLASRRGWIARIANPHLAISQWDRVFGAAFWAWLIFGAVSLMFHGFWLWYLCAAIDLLIAVPRFIQCLLHIAQQRPTLSDEGFGQH
jgi:hypothetical protein